MNYISRKSFIFALDDYDPSIIIIKKLSNLVFKTTSLLHISLQFLLGIALKDAAQKLQARGSESVESLLNKGIPSS